jgi:hypothetical protein
MTYATLALLTQLNEDRQDHARYMMLLGFIIGFVSGVAYCVFAPTLPVLIKYLHLYHGLRLPVWLNLCGA